MTFIFLKGNTYQVQVLEIGIEPQVRDLDIIKGNHRNKDKHCVLQSSQGRYVVQVQFENAYFFRRKKRSQG